MKPFALIALWLTILSNLKAQVDWPMFGDIKPSFIDISTATDFCGEIIKNLPGNEPSCLMDTCEDSVRIEYANILCRFLCIIPDKQHNQKPGEGVCEKKTDKDGITDGATCTCKNGDPILTSLVCATINECVCKSCKGPNGIYDKQECTKINNSISIKCSYSKI